MTKIIALGALLSIPFFISLLRSSPKYRPYAFLAIGLLPFLSDLPLLGHIYGWPTWMAPARGVAFSFVDAIALAVIFTRPKGRVRLPFWPLFAVYGAIMVASIISSPEWIASVFTCWQFLCVLVLFAAVGGECHRPELRNSVLAGFALGLVYQAGHVVFQKLSGAIQAGGTMGHQNILGLVIELAVIPIFAALLAGQRQKLLVAGVVATLVCLAGSGSRATLGIVGGGLAILAIASAIRRPTSRKFTMIALAAVAAAVATPFAIGTLNERFKGGSYVTEETEREAFEKAARSMAADHPFGVGVNQYVFVSNRDGYAARANVSWRVSSRSVPVHNSYLLTQAETGLLGLCAFIALLCIPMIRSVHLAFSQRKSVVGDLALGSAVALLANAIHYNYEFAAFLFPVQALLFINLGLIAAYIRERQTVRQQQRGEKKRRAPLSPVFDQPAVGHSA